MDLRSAVMDMHPQELDLLERHIQNERARRFGGAAGVMVEAKSPLVRGEAMDRTVSVGAGSSGPRGLTLDNVEDAFRYHPWNGIQREAGDQVREALIAAAKVALRIVPDGPDRSAGLRKLREARMDFNSAITHAGRF